MILVFICGFILDLMFADPAWLPHPVIIIGGWISRLEKVLRKILPKTAKGELIGGGILVLLILVGTFGITSISYNELFSNSVFINSFVAYPIPKPALTKSIIKFYITNLILNLRFP